MIPYGRQHIDEQDVAAVADALRSGWLTTGPAVERFEADVAAFVGAEHAVAVANGTAALHVAALTLGLAPGDEVVVTPMTFAATANAVAYTGARPVFADVRACDLLIDPVAVEAAVTGRTRAVFAVDFAGQPCDWDALREIADRRGLALLDDAAHALGAEYRDRRIGGIADLTTFSFHPVKHITTGEGGMIATADAALAASMRSLRNHGITVDHRQREAAGSWFYEIDRLGFNYRITDIQCALGSAQLRRLPEWLARRREIAARYDAAFAGVDGVSPLCVAPDVAHAYHLYVVRLADGIDRAGVFEAMREAGVGVNVHYIPVHLHPYYRRKWGTHSGMCPVAEAAYEHILSLPMYSDLRDDEVQVVIDALTRAVARA